MANKTTTPSPDVLRAFLALGEDVEYCPVCRGDFIGGVWCRDCGHDERLTPTMPESTNGIE